VPCIENITVDRDHPRHGILRQLTWQTPTRIHLHDLQHIHLPEPESLIFERTKAICEMRLGRNEDAQALLGDTRPLDVIFTCLKKIRKSVDRWNKRGGRRGYLQFASQFIM
jgi:hypothetical protein